MYYTACIGISACCPVTSDHSAYCSATAQAVSAYQQEHLSLVVVRIEDLPEVDGELFPAFAEKLAELIDSCFWPLLAP